MRRRTIKMLRETAEFTRWLMSVALAAICGIPSVVAITVAIISLCNTKIVQGLIFGTISVPLMFLALVIYFGKMALDD